MDENWGPWVSVASAMPPEFDPIRVKVFDDVTHAFVGISYGRRVGLVFYPGNERVGAPFDGAYVGEFSIRRPRALAQLRAIALLTDLPQPAAPKVPA